MENEPIACRYCGALPDTVYSGALDAGIPAADAICCWMEEAREMARWDQSERCRAMRVG